jgi:hypothetical protein
LFVDTPIKLYFESVWKSISRVRCILLDVGYKRKRYRTCDNENDISSDGLFQPLVPFLTMLGIGVVVWLLW